MLNQEDHELNKKENLLYNMIVQLENKVQGQEQMIEWMKKDMTSLLRMVKEVMNKQETK